MFGGIYIWLDPVMSPKHSTLAYYPHIILQNRRKRRRFLNGPPAKTKVLFSRPAATVPAIQTVCTVVTENLSPKKFTYKFNDAQLIRRRL